MKLERMLDLGRTLRVLGVDDAPFARRPGSRVPICGVVCADTRFEGMLWGHTRRDGWRATDALIALVTGSKFRDQIDVMLLDGIALGGFNVVDLPRLHEAVGVPCAAVMRRHPDMDAVHAAIARLPQPTRRVAVLARAGAIHAEAPFVFQVAGCDAATMARALRVATREGHVPEALRMAHLIGSAVMRGESSRRA